MPSKKRTMQEALDGFAHLRSLYSELGERAGADAASALARLVREMVLLTAGQTDATGKAISTEAQWQGIVRDIDQLLVQGQAEQAKLFRDLYGKWADQTLRSVPEAYAAFGRPTLGALESARDILLEEARGDIYNGGFRQWVTRFNDAGGGLRSQMQQSFIEAQINGWDQRALSKRLLQVPEFQFANLPRIGERGWNIFTMGGNLGTADALVRRAHLIAVTETTGNMQRLHRSWTKAAGMDLYVNVNDVPVAEECIEANEQRPMTWTEWENWLASNGKGGTPPRHPKCDSLLAGVPSGFESVAAAVMEESTVS